MEDETKEILLNIMNLCVECIKIKEDYVVEFDKRKQAVELRIFYNGWNGLISHKNNTEYIITSFSDIQGLKKILKKISELKKE